MGKNDNAYIFGDDATETTLEDRAGNDAHLKAIRAQIAQTGDPDLRAVLEQELVRCFQPRPVLID